jgi:putative hydrolase of the HAD superfamily
MVTLLKYRKDASMNLPKAILFDLDDTIISFTSAKELAWEKCCEVFVTTEAVTFNSVTLLHKILEKRKWYWSDPARHKAGRENMKIAIRQIVQYAFEDLDYYDIEKSDQLADNHSALQDEFLCLFDGAYEALQILSDLNIRMAIIANGKSQIQRVKLDRFNLNGFFEFILIETEVGFRKPDIRIYELALEQLSLSSEDVWMVGDNLEWDIEAPQKVGIYSIWNDFRKEGLPINPSIIPNKIINSIADLAKDIRAQSQLGI